MVRSIDPIPEQKKFRIFLENSEYREVNKTRFMVLEKILDF